MRYGAQAARQPWVLYLLIGSFLGVAVLYNVSTPVFEAPDELQHVAYAVWLADAGALPVVSLAGSQPGPWEQEGTQPPLYYWFAATLAVGVPHRGAESLATLNPYAGIGDPQRPDNKNRVLHNLEAERWPYRGTVLLVHLIRALSTLMSVGTLLAIYFLGRRVVPERPAIALGMTGLMAFIPQFLSMSTAANNDNLVILIASWGLVLLAGWLVGPRGSDPHRRLPGWLSLGALGVLLGLGALSKLSGVLLWPLAGGVLVWLAWRERRLRWLLPAGLVVFGLALAISGWWFVRNLQLYGDLTGLAAHLQIVGTRRRIPSFVQAVREFRGFRYSFWALFGWFNILAPGLFYHVLDGLTLLGIIGWCLWLFRSYRKRRQGEPSELRTPAVLMLAGWLLLVSFGVLRWTLLTRASQGRLLYPALPAIAFFLVVGWAELLPGRIRKGTAIAASAKAEPVVVASAAIVTGWGVWAALCPFLFIRPAYALPERAAALENVACGGASESNCILSDIQVQFGDCCQLVSYVPPSTGVHPGDRVPLKLVWHALEPTREDYSLFVHAVTVDGEVLGQLDTYHGGGMYPTSQWRPGEYIADTVYVPLSWRAGGPALLRFSVGLQGSTQLPATTSDGQALDTVFAGETGLIPLEWPAVPQAMGQGPAGTPVAAVFAEQIRLTDVDLPLAAVKPGSTVTVTLHWEALATIGDDYVGFVHMVDATGIDVAQDDHLPCNGAYPTRVWGEGAIVADPYRLELLPNLGPGSYGLWVGLYRAISSERLQAVREVTGERWQDDLVYVGSLRVSRDEP